LLHKNVIYERTTEKLYLPQICGRSLSRRRL